LAMRSCSTERPKAWRIARISKGSPPVPRAHAASIAALPRSHALQRPLYALASVGCKRAAVSDSPRVARAQRGPSAACRARSARVLPHRRLQSATPRESARCGEHRLPAIARARARISAASRRAMSRNRPAEDGGGLHDVDQVMGRASCAQGRRLAVPTSMPR
jgi:hypothetical protein